MRCTSALLALVDARKVDARVRHDRRAARAGDHRGLRPLRPDRLARAAHGGIPFTALEASYAQVDFVRRFGNRIYYGDASRLELLQAAKAGEAKLFVLAIDDVEASVKTRARGAQALPATWRSSRARATACTISGCATSACRAIHRETFPGEPRRRAPGAAQARLRRRGRAARGDISSASTTKRSSRRSTPSTTTKRSSCRPRSRRRRSCGSCSRPTSRSRPREFAGRSDAESGRAGQSRQHGRSTHGRAKSARPAFRSTICSRSAGARARSTRAARSAREQLAALLEAARWAPSCNGDEPWRYLVWDRARDPEGWQKAFDCLSENNRKWVKNVPVLMLSCAGSIFAHNGKPNRYGPHDTGAASMSHRAAGGALGLAVHQMGGFDAAKARAAFAHSRGIHADGDDRGRLPGFARRARRRDEAEGAEAAVAQAAGGAVLRRRAGASASSSRRGARSDGLSQR